MPFPLGQGSYVGIAQQAGPVGWGGSLVTTGLKTFPNLGGDVLSPTAGRAARRSITTAMARASQTYRTVDLVNVAFNFEVVTDPTAFKPLLLWAWGTRKLTGTTPNYIDKYTVPTVAFDLAADETPGADPKDADFWNHSASVHVFLSPDGTSVANMRYSVKDAICTQFEWSGEANGATVMSFQGTGRNLAASASTVAFTDQASSILSWDRAANATPGGLYMDTAATPTTLWKVRNFRFTLSQPHTFETGLGALAGGEMFTPFRTSPPTATLAYETFFEDAASGTDPAQNMTDFIASTGQGVYIMYRIATNDYMRVAAHGSVDPAFINNPTIGWSNNGAVGFGAQLQCYPDAATDLYFDHGMNSGT